MEAWLESNVHYSLKQRILFLEKGIYYKCISRTWIWIDAWYRTSVLLHKIFPQTSPQCWHGKQADGKLLHIFWECPELQNVWTTISSAIILLTNITLKPNLVVFLLHLSDVALHKYKHSLLKHLLTVAKACIPPLWKFSTRLTKSMWIARLNDIQLVEKLTADLLDRHEQYSVTWTHWHYTGI